MAPPTLRSRNRTLAAALLSGALFASGCASDSAVVPDASTLAWFDCGDLECAVLEVPRDHLDPEGATIGIDINRSRARDSPERRGVLLVNPGGPGGSGITLARSLARDNDALADAFDIIGWDPRGVGATANLACDQPLIDYYRLDNTPDSPEERMALDRAADSAASACASADEPLLGAIGSANVAEDIDAIRVALGEDQISYLGYSYGTLLGLVYADRHGEHLRAAVLDGVLDPTFSLEEWLTSQAVATEDALVRVLEQCPSCEDGLETLETLIARADAGTLTASESLSPSDVTRAAIVATYDDAIAQRFLAAIERALDGDGDDLRALSDEFLGLASFDVYTAVSCVDNEHPVGPEAFDAFVDRITSVAPVLGPPIANELRPCATWRATAVAPLTTLSDATAPPMLILGNTGDSATPYADAVAVSERLDKARLLTYEGTGHTSYQEGSQCVDAAVERYLLDLVLPPTGTICR